MHSLKKEKWHRLDAITYDNGLIIGDCETRPCSKEVRCLRVIMRKGLMSYETGTYDVDQRSSDYEKPVTSGSGNNVNSSHSYEF